MSSSPTTPTTTSTQPLAHANQDSHGSDATNHVSLAPHNCATQHQSDKSQPLSDHVQDATTPQSPTLMEAISSDAMYYTTPISPNAIVATEDVSTEGSATDNNSASAEPCFECIVCYRKRPRAESEYLSTYCAYNPHTPKNRKGQKYRTCNSCLKEYVLRVVKQSLDDRVPCLYGSTCSCHAYFSDITRIFRDDPDGLERCHDIINRKHLQKMEEFIECAFPDCSYAEILSECSLQDAKDSALRYKQNQESAKSTTDSNARQTLNDDSKEELEVDQASDDSREADQKELSNTTVEHDTPTTTTTTTTTTTIKTEPQNAAPDHIWTCRLCHRDTCIRHRIPYHANLTCDEFDDENRDAEEKTQRWIAKNTRKCKNCGLPIQKNRGCSTMACRCEHQFTWRDASSWSFSIGIPVILGVFACIGCCTCCFCCCCFGRVKNIDWDPRRDESFRRWT